MLSTMREKTKIVMVVLAVAFVGWLVFGVGMDITGRGNNQARTVGSVNGTPIGYQAYLDAYRTAYDAARAQSPGVTFSREDQRDIENRAFNQLVDVELMRQEYQRHGIVVTDREIVELVRRQPPAEVQAIPDLQTNGHFDPNKYERFLASNNATTRAFLLEMEGRAREELPRFKLLEEVTSDVYASDARLWTVWHDQHDSLTVKALVIRPTGLPAGSVAPPTDSEAQSYYRAHPGEFKQPARAYLSFVALSKLPTSVDSVQLVARARAIRDSLRHGADFAALARTESGDSSSRVNGGSLGTFGHGQMVKQFEDAAFRLPVGQISDPVFSEFGIHIIKVEKRTRDSVTARHILIPYGRVGARLDSLEARADSLDRLAAEQTERGTLDSVAKKLGLVVEQHGPVLYQGLPYVLGRYRIPDVGLWAFEAHPGETSQVIETSGAYYVFRLDSVKVAGVPPLAEVREQAMSGAMQDKQRATAEAIGRDAERRVNNGATIEAAGEAVHATVTPIGPFTRTATVPILGTATEAVGAAFRLRIAEHTTLLHNGDAYFILRADRHSTVDSSAWVAQKDRQRADMISAARQLRVRYYIEALRRQAKIVDRRAEVMRPQQKAAGTS
ncbi:MAG: SurA N-terminal domain-containing protein [Gemmatimonadales bacterium]